MRQKSALRVKYQKIRQELCSAEKDAEIARRFLSSPYAAYESFFVYLSFGAEVDTSGLIKALKRAGKTVCAPRITGKGEMISLPLGENLTKNKFGISEPQAGEEITCVVAVTPLLASDRQGYRLGYGGGYYDRYFALHPEILRVGLMYAGQAADSFPHEETDLPLDAVVTEEGWHLFENGRR